ncbi:RNA polymerase sigma factor [Roseburia sp. 499]|uniref:RNA polymerase sigma factor n=1 Tax=Roseburia sp. 499 TaxID=1261634 RepID=UPI001FA8E159|nr:sigma factor [Roseburia sp. 499]WVK71071.1 sigma factor [Roseburia sp. 499]
MDITTIFKNYHTYIYNYALKLTCHPQDAQDITQETFVKAWEKLDELKDENAVAKWL